VPCQRASGLPFVLAGLFAAAWAAPAEAIPSYAQQYGVTCSKCHQVIPQLNEFGAAFLANGYRIPGVKPGPAFPIAAKVNYVASSENQGEGPDGAGLPKQIVDEVEAFVGGAIGSRGSYLAEQYFVDGGQPGLLRDAWVMDRLNPYGARIPVFLQGGQSTLPLLIDPETFRTSYQGYTVYEQTVGGNPFNFFEPKLGARLGVGDLLRGTSVQLFAGPGHDAQSGLPSTGTDWMAYGQQAAGPWTAALYRYQGTRPVDGQMDHFERTGYGLVFNNWGRWLGESLLQTGFDSACGAGTSGGCASSGGFVQMRYSFNRHVFALGRYEGTNGPNDGFSRDGVLLLGFGPTEWSRITVEDVIGHSPQTSNTLNVQFTLAF
jgi:hypothetical protein